MKYKFIVRILFVCLIFNSTIHAQLLKETVSKFDSINKLTYEMTIKEKDPFSDSIINDTIKASFELSGDKELFKITGTKDEEICNGNQLIKLNLNNLTYRVASSIENSIFLSRSLPYIINSLKQDIKNNVPIKLQNDSLINGKKYYHIEIIELDTIEKNKRLYRFIEVLIDKQNYLPFYYKSNNRGFVDGTDIFVDLSSEMNFYSYHLNEKDFPNLSDLTIPANFIREAPQVSKSLLNEGTKAPELNLKDTLGNTFKLKSQKGKIVLLNFTFNSCPHCVESTKMLNALYSKYGKNNFSIVTINPFDTKEGIKKYNKKFKVKYSSFINNGTQNIDNYNVDTYPTFYLIDKTRNIIKGFQGYYVSLDDELNKLIKKYL